jgi:putative peptidoglycan lipid II flippase
VRKERPFRDRILNTESTRAAAAVTATASLGGKALGGVKLLLVAHLFGAGAAMDSYYVALGVVLLASHAGKRALEASLLPRLARIRDEEEKEALAAALFRRFAVTGTLFALACILFPRHLVHLFAWGFGPERLDQGAAMLRFLSPYVLAALLFGLANVWLIHRRTYTLPALLQAGQNLVAIPAILFFAPVLGVKSIPLAVSLAMISVFLLSFRMSGLPVVCSRTRRRTAAKGILKNFLLALGIVGAGLLYELTDRFFASGLPPGNVAALSYAILLFNFPISLFVPALLVYVGKASSLAAVDLQGAENQLERALSTGFAFFLPAGFAMWAAAVPVVGLLLHHGAFDETAAVITSSCFGIYALGIPLAVAGIIFGKFAIAAGFLRTAMICSYLTVAVNAILDWLFAPVFGASGIAAATVFVWIVSLGLSMRFIAPAAAKGFFSANLLFQVLLAAAWAAGIRAFAPLAGYWSIPVAGVIAALHMFFCERAGWYEDVPNNWRPTALLMWLWSYVK